MAVRHSHHRFQILSKHGIFQVITYTLQETVISRRRKIGVFYSLEYDQTLKDTKPINSLIY